MNGTRLLSPLTRRLGKSGHKNGSLQRSLLLAFLVLTFLPLIILSPVLRQQVAAQTTELIVAQLGLVATLKEQQIQDFLEERTQDLSQVLRTSEARENALFVLQRSPQAEGYRFVQATTYDLFLSVQRETDDIAELFLVNRAGDVIVSTDPEHRERNESGQSFLSAGLQGNYVSPFLLDPESGETFVYLAEPVRDFSAGGVPRGVLVARIDPSTLSELMLADTGLGETGETYLVSAQRQLLTPVRHQISSPPDLNTYGIQESLARREGADQYRNYAGTEVIGFYRWLPEVGAALLAEQARSEAFAVLDRLTRFVLIAVAILAIVVTVAILTITRRISRPIVQLTESAARVASGEFGHTVPVTRSDEIGMLADSFNQMSIALQDSYANLEQKVAERTEQLGAANEYLTALHETTLGLISRLDLNDLLQALVTRAGQLLGTPHGYIYLVEPDSGELERKVGVGIYSKSIGFRLKLGEGVAGKVWKTGQPLLVNDFSTWPGRAQRSDTTIGALLGAPLTHITDTAGSGSQIMGVIGMAYDRESGRTFDDGKVELLSRFAQLASLALDNAQLYTSAQQAKEAAEKAREAAEAASEAKGTFLANVSHELRTPLTSVLGFAKIIRKRLHDVIFPRLEADEDRKIQRAIRQIEQNIDIIVSEGERLTDLINDVLDIAKIEAGKVEWEMEPLVISEVIDRSIAATSSLFAHKRLELIKDIKNNLPPIIGDKDKLIQVVINLISNAVKFTDCGSVTCQAQKNEYSIVVSVIDTGVGVPLNDQLEIFEKFKQVGDTLTEKPQGTGLGLAICKQIIEHHGGQIWVESEIGAGSTFSFSLPLEEELSLERVFDKLADEKP